MVNYDHRRSISLILDEHASKREHVRRQQDAGHITPEGAEDQLDKWRRQQRWDPRLDLIRSNSEGQVAVAEARRAMTLRRLSEDGQPGDSEARKMRAEMHIARVWNRTRDRLDRSTDDAQVMALVPQLVAQAAAEDLPALVQELPSYLTARRIPPNLLDDALAQRPELADTTRELTQARKQHQDVINDVLLATDVLNGSRNPDVVRGLMGGDQ